MYKDQSYCLYKSNVWLFLSDKGQKSIAKDYNYITK